MSHATVSPQPRRRLLDETFPLGRMSKPELSRCVLLATAFVVASVLLIWLLLFILIRDGGLVTGYWVAQRGVASPVLPFQADDLRRVLGRPAAAKPRDLLSSDLAALLRDRMARAGDRPAVIYLSAAGVSGGRRAELLATNYRPALTARDAGRASLAADEPLDALGDSPSRPRLLILDAGQVGTDRNLGVFGNGFVHRLATLLKERKPKGLAVLCSCAPGQISWASEADRQTVFGHYVARGLSGEAAGWDPSVRGLTVRALANYVRDHVSRWVTENRQAQQTPILLTAGEAANFPLRPSVSASTLMAERVDPKEDAELMARLEQGWTRRDELEAGKPFRSAPLLWRRYQETLLRAERMTRAGQGAEATKILADLAGLERALLERAAGIPLGEPLSLALAASPWAGASAADRERAAAYREAIEANLSELSDGTPAGRSAAEAETDLAPEPPPPPAAPAEDAANAAGRDFGRSRGCRPPGTRNVRRSWRRRSSSGPPPSRSEARPTGSASRGISTAAVPGRSETSSPSGSPPRRPPPGTSGSGTGSPRSSKPATPSAARRRTASSGLNRAVSPTPAPPEARRSGPASCTNRPRATPTSARGL
jgi:hypothetical protein